MKNIKKKSKIRIIALAVCFVVFWGAVLAVVQNLLSPKYQTGVVEGSMVAEYYNETTDHEVIMIGDCEVYENISTIELWRKYGITSYIRGSAQQLVWQSYYLLEDTLRYETPKVVVFNVLALKYNEPQSEAYNRMTLDGMRWSESKLNAIKASMTSDEDIADYLFPLLRYHSRWSELTDDDYKHVFLKSPVTHSGYYMRVDVKAQDEFPEPIRLTDYTLGANAMSYLDKMTELCKEKGIDLVLIKAPVEFPHWYEQWDSQIVDYAKENGLEYINFIPLRDEMGIDMSVDTYDAGLHLNLTGAEKMADYFGGWLKEHYNLADYRTDEKYSAVWQKKAENYEKEKQEQYRELEEYGKIISRSPIETKETGIMKNFIILAVAAILCLVLVACGGNETTDTSVASETESNAVSATVSTPSGSITAKTNGYVFKYKGVYIAIDALNAPIVESLGEPTKYFESESCAFQGLDKVYTYGGVIIRTYPMDGVDYVLSVELKDDTVSTPEGVSIGDTKEKVTKAYGTPASELADSVSFTKGGVTLAFFFEGDSVSDITYTAELTDN